jgi:UDP-N-acetylmuramoylalanine--D-glutamate ligase
LVYHILKSAGLKVGLAGNVGDSFAKQVIEDTFDYFVLELSSFQLDNCYDFKADIAILLNITPDHLDRYEYNFQNYVNSKFRILQNMTPSDHFIYFQESEALAKELTQKVYAVNHLPVSIQEEVAQGAFVQNGVLEAKFQARDFQVDIDKLPIKGTHNSINASCAVLASQAIGLNDEQIMEGYFHSKVWSIA